MKKYSLFKRGVAIAFAVIAAISASAQGTPKSAGGQSYTFVMPAGFTTNWATPLTFDVSKSQVNGFQVEGTSSAGATGDALFLAPSMDGIGMDTNHTVTIYSPVTTLAGGNYIWTSTNITTSATLTLFLYSATNLTGVTVTNTIKNNLKLQAP